MADLAGTENHKRTQKRVKVSQCCAVSSRKMSWITRKRGITRQWFIPKTLKTTRECRIC